MTEKQHIEINPEVFIWARERLGLSQSAAAKKLEISVRSLEKFETGVRKPTLEELKNFSKVYKRTIATLLLDKPPKEKPFPKDRRTVESRELNVFNEKTILAVRKARALVDSFIELNKENNIPIKNFRKIISEIAPQISINEEPFELAAELRKRIGLKELRDLSNPKLALEASIEKTENLGIAVFQISLNEDQLRGFSLTDEEIPVIVIKRSDQPTGKIFTLFHELGHIILNEGGLCDISLSPTSQKIEKWCNSFAAEILVPQEEILGLPIIAEKSASEIKEWQKKELIEIGNHFHVGPLVILRKLLDNKLTTQNFYKEKHEKWNKPFTGFGTSGEGRNIPKEAINEKGRTYVGLAFRAFDQNRISLKDLSDYLGIKISYLDKTRQLLHTI